MAAPRRSAILPGVALRDRRGVQRPPERVYPCFWCSKPLTSKDCRVGVVGIVVQTSDHGCVRKPVHKRCDEIENMIGLF